MTDTEEPTHASLSGLWQYLAAAVRQVRPHWKEMSVVVLASVPQVALETAQPMMLMVLIDAIVARDEARVWLAVLGLVALIPIYITGMSFEFSIVRPHGERFEQRGGQTTRVISDMVIREVSIVTFPVYAETDVAVARRSLQAFAAQRQGRSIAWLQKRAAIGQ